MKNILMNTAVMVLLTLTSSLALAIEGRTNLTLGWAKATQTIATKEDFESIGGSLDALVGWGPFRAGVIYAKTDYAPLYEPKQEISGVGGVIGLGISRWVEVLVGLGAGSSKREVDAANDTSFDSVASFAGVRLHLFEVKKITFGISATYMGLSNDRYSSKASGVTTETLKDVESSMIVYGLNFNFATKKSK